MCDRNTKFAIGVVIRRQIKISDVRAGNTIALRIIQNPNSTLPAQMKRKMSPCKYMRIIKLTGITNISSFFLYNTFSFNCALTLAIEVYRKKVL